MLAKYSEIQNKYWGNTFPHPAFRQLSYPLGFVSNPFASPSEWEGSLTKQKLIHGSEKKKISYVFLAQTTDCSDLMNTQEEAVENSHTKKPPLMSVLESL